VKIDVLQYKKQVWLIFGLSLALKLLVLFIGLIFITNGKTGSKYVELFLSPEITILFQSIFVTQH